MRLVFLPNILYTCFVLHNICEKHGASVEDVAVARQLAYERLLPDNAPDRLYSFNTAEENQYWEYHHSFFTGSIFHINQHSYIPTLLSFSSEEEVASNRNIGSCSRYKHQTCCCIEKLRADCHR